MMKTIRVKEGVTLSSIALGESRRGNPDREATAFQVMDRYIELGGTTFDSARAYDDGGADRALGKWLKSRGLRDQVTVVTKGSLCHRENRFLSRLSPEEIECDLNESLAFMGIDCADLHLLHRDDVDIPVEKIVPVLSGLVKAGKARAVGVSNWTVGRIIQANEFALANGYEPLRCCQLLFTLAQTTAAMTGDITHVPMNEIELGWYKETQFPVMGFGAQARGWFAARAAGQEPRESPRKYYDALPENHRRLIRVKKLSEKLGVPLSAVTCAYVRDRGANASVLCSFSSIAQLEEVFQAETIRLSVDQIKYLETGVGTC